MIEWFWGDIQEQRNMVLSAAGFEMGHEMEGDRGLTVSDTGIVSISVGVRCEFERAGD